MNLLTLLTQELPLMGGWPSGVDDITQDEDGQLFYGYDEYSVLTQSGIYLDLSCDFRSRFVTRDQYETALIKSNEDLCELSRATIESIRKNL